MKLIRGHMTVASLVLVVTLSQQSATYGNLFQRSRAGIAVWDTGTPSATPLGPVALADKNGWTRIPRNQKPESFKGDAVMTNGRVLAVLRKKDSAVELFSMGASGAVSRVRLRLQGPDGEPATRLERIAVVENTRGAARLETVFRTANGSAIAAKFRVKRGEISIETEPGPGAHQMRVESPSRFVVLPDFFADDILIDATKMPVSSAEIPSENFLLHLTGKNDAIAMCVFENSDQDVRVTFSGADDRRIITGSEIRFGKVRKVVKSEKIVKSGKIWVALLAGPQIWHALNVNEESTGKIIPLDWTMPFPAQWRMDFTRRNDLTDSWEMLYPSKDGNGYIKPSWLPSGSQGGKPSTTATGEIDFDAYKIGGPASNRLGPDRKRWITVLGRYQYPCWTDNQQRGFIQPLKNKAMAFRGPAVIYPINRLSETPVDTYTTVDVVRGTLGVGPCEYLLNVEGQRQDHVGRATCHVRTLLNEIYGNKQQKAKQKEIKTYLLDGLDFVKHIRNRITLYVEFGHEMREYLAAQKKAHPELKKSLTEMEQIVSELDTRLAKRRDGIKSVEYVVALNNGFHKNLLGYDGADSLVRLKSYTDALTSVGGSQDGLVGECRWIVRTLRQRAALTMAIDPRFAPIAKEIRARTQKVLLKPSAYEGARH